MSLAIAIVAVVVVVAVAVVVVVARVVGQCQANKRVDEVNWHNFVYISGVPSNSPQMAVIDGGW